MFSQVLLILFSSLLYFSFVGCNDDIYISKNEVHMFHKNDNEHYCVKNQHWHTVKPNSVLTIILDELGDPVGTSCLTLHNGFQIPYNAKNKDNEPYKLKFQIKNNSAWMSDTWICKMLKNNIDTYIYINIHITGYPPTMIVNYVITRNQKKDFTHLDNYIFQSQEINVDCISDETCGVQDADTKISYELSRRQRYGNESFSMYVPYMNKVYFLENGNYQDVNRTVLELSCDYCGKSEPKVEEQLTCMGKLANSNNVKIYTINKKKGAGSSSTLPIRDTHSMGSSPPRSSLPSKRTTTTTSPPVLGSSFFKPTRPAYVTKGSEPPRSHSPSKRTTTATSAPIIGSSSTQPTRDAHTKVTDPLRSHSSSTGIKTTSAPVTEQSNDEWIAAAVIVPLLAAIICVLVIIWKRKKMNYISWFQRKSPENEYAYCTGNIVSASHSEHHEYQYIVPEGEMCENELYKDYYAKVKPKNQRQCKSKVDAKVELINQSQDTKPHVNAVPDTRKKIEKNNELYELRANHVQPTLKIKRGKSSNKSIIAEKISNTNAPNNYEIIKDNSGFYESTSRLYSIPNKSLIAKEERSNIASHSNNVYREPFDKIKTIDDDTYTNLVDGPQYANKIGGYCIHPTYSEPYIKK